jgi:hypothetical protein
MEFINIIQGNGYSYALGEARTLRIGGVISLV